MPVPSLASQPYFSPYAHARAKVGGPAHFRTRMRIRGKIRLACETSQYLGGLSDWVVAHHWTLVHYPGREGEGEREGGGKGGAGKGRERGGKGERGKGERGKGERGEGREGERGKGGRGEGREGERGKGGRGVCNGYMYL